MLPSNIKNIIFDYGNVIFQLDFLKSKYAWEELGIDNANDFYSHKIQDPIFTAFERGDISAKEFRDAIRVLTNKKELTDQQIDHAWNSLLVGITKGNHELLQSLKPQYRTFLLSNINEIHFDYIMKYLKTDFGFDSNDHLFEKVYYSHLMGKRKPEAEIFEQVLTENNLNPAETLFIDDSPQHIEGAKKLGIHTYLMTAPNSIQKLFGFTG
ncbi:HAD family hydrolase [Mucilaginibacter sp. X4EP1]|uniref:HAD family hydrolase n=1 Tax=Mucilaginibacter sp. X4EP1 TaxID=2723092 RepID=UPI00216A2974|nr:HAD family phosphatase [Mucilaginibacter sp. X4EP1]MCS3812763.1 putative hydrolase of the HAD superfamily [Mucilaginibacter sp. X4EP1]